jgi:hypothetical protein
VKTSNPTRGHLMIIIKEIAMQTGPFMGMKIILRLDLEK